MGVSLFALAVVITWSAFAYVTLYNKEIALPVMRICNVMTVTAAIVGITYIYTSARLSYDEDLERLHARRDATVLVSLAVDCVATNTLLGLLIDAMNHDASIVPMMSTPATMAGIVLMVTAVASMIVLAIIGKAERQVRQDASRPKGGKEIPFRQGQEVVTAYDVRKAQLASQAYYDEGAKATGDIQSYIPLSQIGITRIGTPAESRIGATRPKTKENPEAGGTGRKREMPLKDSIAEALARKKAKLSQIVPEIDKRRHEGGSSGDANPEAVPPSDGVPGDPAPSADEKPGFELDELEMPGLVESIKAPSDSGKEPADGTGSDESAPMRLSAIATSVSLVDEPEDGTAEGNDDAVKPDAGDVEPDADAVEPDVEATGPDATVTSPDAEAGDGSPAGDSSRHEKRPPRTGTEDGTGWAHAVSPATVSPADGGHGTGDSPADAARRHGKGVLWHVTELLAAVGERCVGAGSSAQAWIKHAWATVAEGASGLASACRDALGRAWAGASSHVRAMAPAIRDRASSARRHIADGASAWAERGASLVRSMRGRGGTGADGSTEEAGDMGKRLNEDAGKANRGPIETGDAEPTESGSAPDMVPTVAEDAGSSTVAGAEEAPVTTEDPEGALLADDEGPAVAVEADGGGQAADSLGPEASQDGDGPSDYPDLSDKAVPPFMKKIWETSRTKGGRH